MGLSVYIGYDWKKILKREMFVGFDGLGCKLLMYIKRSFLLLCLRVDLEY